MIQKIYFPDNFPYKALAKLGYTKQKWMIRAIRLRKKAMDLLESKKWERKGSDTFCGQYAQDVLLKYGCNLSQLNEGRSLYNINTTMSYYNCIKNGAYEIIDSQGNPDPEMAFYINRFGVPVDVLSPKDLIIDDIRYNHSLLLWPLFFTEYNDLTGPSIIQEGYKGFQGYISNIYAYGDNWKNQRIKYFIFPLKKEESIT